MQRASDVIDGSPSLVAIKAGEARRRNPDIAKREREIASYRGTTLELLICPLCDGYALPNPGGPSCQGCEGMGLVCPTCRGMRWVTHDPGNSDPEQRIRRCHSCCDPAGVYDAARETRIIGHWINRAKGQVA